MKSESARSRYSELINENADISERFAKNIEMASLDDDTANMISSALLEVQKACGKRTLTEKCVEKLPAVIGNRIQGMMDHTTLTNMRHKNVAEIAAKHFKTLSEKRDSVRDNVSTLYDIEEKLHTSINLFKDLQDDVAADIEELKTKNDSQSKKDLLICKEISINIASQIAVQSDLVNQVEMVLFTGDMILDTLNQTLPGLKSNFIDQLSITTALDNMKRLKTMLTEHATWLAICKNKPSLTQRRL